MVSGIIVRTIRGQVVEAAADEWLLQGADPIDLWPVDPEVFGTSYEKVPG